MRVPGTRYQEHGWEQVRKLLGQCSLQSLTHAQLARTCDPGDAPGVLPEYVDALAASLHVVARSSRAQASGNSYGDSVAELALGLACELLARPADWMALAAALATERLRLGDFWGRAEGTPILRKKFNDMYALLRDKVDSDNYQVACGRPCSPNRMYGYRMLDSAFAEIARLFADPHAHREQVAAILGLPEGDAPPRTPHLPNAGYCKPEWIMRWSASLERFTGSPGPLHTRSKRFDSLKANPAAMAAMLAEMADYEALSANADADWRQDAGDALAWLDDLERVLGGEYADGGGDAAAEAPAGASAEDMLIAAGVSLPPRFIEAADAAGAGAGRAARCLDGCSLPVRLAVCLKLLGPHDDCYPADWLDPATGELPTMQQLAALERVSLPTLRKRRDQAIERIRQTGTSADARRGHARLA